MCNATQKKANYQLQLHPLGSLTFNLSNAHVQCRTVARKSSIGGL